MTRLSRPVVEVDPLVKVDPVKFDPLKTCKLKSVKIHTVPKIIQFRKIIQFKNAFRIALARSGTEINGFLCFEHLI